MTKIEKIYKHYRKNALETKGQKQLWDEWMQQYSIKG
jgi:hypothetical protein